MTGALSPTVESLVRDGARGVEFSRGVVSERDGTSIAVECADGPQQAELPRDGENPALQPTTGDTVPLAALDGNLYATAILRESTVLIDQTGGIEVLNPESRIAIRDGNLEIIDQQ